MNFRIELFSVFPFLWKSKRRAHSTVFDQRLFIPFPVCGNQFPVPVPIDLVERRTEAARNAHVAPLSGGRRPRKIVDRNHAPVSVQADPAADSVLRFLRVRKIPEPFLQRTDCLFRKPGRLLSGRHLFRICESQTLRAFRPDDFSERRRHRELPLKGVIQKERQSFSILSQRDLVRNVERKSVARFHRLRLSPVFRDQRDPAGGSHRRKREFFPGIRAAQNKKLFRSGQACLGVAERECETISFLPGRVQRKRDLFLLFPAGSELENLRIVQGAVEVFDFVVQPVSDLGLETVGILLAAEDVEFPERQLLICPRADPVADHFPVDVESGLVLVAAPGEGDMVPLFLLEEVLFENLHLSRYTDREFDRAVLQLEQIEAELPGVIPAGDDRICFRIGLLPVRLEPEGDRAVAGIEFRQPGEGGRRHLIVGVTFHIQRLTDDTRLVARRAVNDAGGHLFPVPTENVGGAVHRHVEYGIRRAQPERKSGEQNG